MALIKYSLAVLCICLLSSGSTAQTQCELELWGSETMFPRQVGTATLQPYQQYFEVTFPDVCSPNNDEGIKVTACDYDVPPVIKVVNTTLAYVYRLGNLMQQGTVTAIKYCPDYWAPMMSSDAELDKPVVATLHGTDTASRSSKRQMVHQIHVGQGQ